MRYQQSHRRGTAVRRIITIRKIQNATPNANYYTVSVYRNRNERKNGTNNGISKEVKKLWKNKLIVIVLFAESES